MFKKVIVMIISLLLPLLAYADELKLRDGAPKSYVVKKGDTLWDISGIYLKQPWLWPKLLRLNPEVSNPHLIYPGDEIRLVYGENGEPMLVKSNGKPQLKWSPQSRTTLKDQSPISTLPLHVVAPFIRYDSILTNEQLDNLPYVIGSDHGNVSSLDGAKVYVNGDLSKGKSYAIYLKGDEILDPETEKPLGYHLVLVGSGKALRSGNMAEKVPSTIYLEGAVREVRPNAIVLPVNDGQLYPSYFTMQAADPMIKGSIIKATSDNREFGKFEVVMINKGAQDAVKQGDVLTIKRKSPAVVETENGPVYTTDTSKWYKIGGDDTSDYKMPEEPIGQMMVFRVYDQVSMALILKTQKPLRLADSVSAP